MKTRILTILFCSLLLCLSALAGGQEASLSNEQRIKKAQDCYAAGKRFFQQGAFAKANEEYKKAQGFLDELKAQNYVSGPSAVSELAAGGGAIKLQKPDPRQIDRSKDKEDIPFYHKAIASSPKNADLYYNLAVEYLMANQFIQARDAFLRVTQLNPRDQDAYYNLGVLYEKYLNDKKQALDCYLQFIKLASQEDDANKVKSWIQQLTEERKAK